MKKKNYRKSLLCIVLGLVLSIIGGNAADVLTLGNADFETAWTGLTDYGSPVILKKVTTIATGVTGWTGDVGSGNLTIYQGPGHTGSNSAVLINTSAAGCRFYNNSVMTLTKGGQYKLTFYARGSATIGNVCLYESATRPTIAQATSGSASGVYDVSKTINSAVSFGNAWTKQEYNFIVPSSSSFNNYKLYFTFYGCNAPLANGTNLSSAFMIDDITFAPSVDNTVCTLTGITVGGKAISNFIATTTNYPVLTNKTPIPTVAATPTDVNATVVVSDPITVGNISTVTVTVTAADGTTKKVYTIVFTSTNDGILEGFGSDVIPTGWTMSQTMTGGDWMIDTGSTYNNGLYIGANSLRIKGGGAPSLTSGWLLIPNVNLPDVMTFYLKTRDVAACTLSVYKRPASVEAFNDLTGWTLCGSFVAPFDVAFTQKNITIGSVENTDILLYVVKDDTKIPFSLDDIRITKKPIVSGITNTSTLGLSTTSNITVTGSGKLTVDANTSVNSLTVEAGGKINIANPLVVKDVVLKADESGSFSANIGAISTVNGTVHYERTMLDTKWYFMSFPCNVNVAEITGGGTIDVDWTIQEYNGAHRATAGFGGNWSHITSGTLIANKGYIFGLKTNAGTKTLSFPLDKTLIQSEAVSTVPATFYDGSAGTNHKGWNLIGQPYLSIFAGTNVGVNYLTTWTGSAYDGKANTEVASINPFEAFFVQVADNNPVSFAIEGRQSVQSLVDAGLSDKVQLNFTSSTGSDNTNLIMDNNQSTSYEINQDLEKWITTGTDKPQIYTLSEGINYAYNALPINCVNNLPVGFYTKTAGSAIISVNASQAPGLSQLLLTDNSTSPAIVTDLLTSDYNFYALAGTDNSRFVVTAQRISTEISQKEETGTPKILMRNGKLEIIDISINDRIRVYNSVGQLLFNNIANKSSLNIPLPTFDMYIIQIESETKSLTRKIFNPKKL